MKRLATLHSMARLTTWLWLVLSIVSCEDSFMKQATANKMGAVTNLQTTVDREGNFIAQIDPTKSETQLMRITQGAIAGAAVAIPPAALSIPVSIMVGEGVALTTNSFSQDLGLTGNNITAGGPSVSFTASQDVVATNPLTLSIPFGALAFALADVNTENLIVMYRWMTLKDGEPSYEVGVIPGDKVTRGQNKVSFQTTKFGTFQVGIAETKITRPLLAATEEPPALKSCERYAAAAFPTCTQDGQVGCVTTDSFKAADTAKILPQNIRSGVTIADVTGDLNASPADCSINGQQSCVANGSFFAGTACPADGSNCFIPQFAYPAAQTMKAVDTSTIDSSKMLESLTIAEITGSIEEKTLDVSSATAFSAGYYKDMANLPSVSDLKDGITVLGVTGTASLSPADCSGNGQTDCVTTTSYKSFDYANLTEGNIKNNVEIAGVTGKYPSLSYPLANSVANVADLNSTNFNATITSNSTFEYFGSDGSRYTGTGTFVDPWDIRSAKTFRSIDGKLKPSCRNRARSTTPTANLTGTIQNTASTAAIVINANNHGLYNGNKIHLNFSPSIQYLSNGTYYVISATPNSFQISNTEYTSIPITVAVPSATVATILPMSETAPSYDNLVTTDDQNGWLSSFPVDRINVWTDATDCFGVDTIATGDEENVWKDVTTSNGTDPSNCSATPANCTIQDKMTGLWWSKSFATSKWDSAWQICLNLAHNFKDDWRLPTQKELLEAYTHSIRSVVTHPNGEFSSNWISDTALAQAFWSGTTVSFSTFDNAAWAISLGKGGSFPNDKNSFQNVACVR